MLTWLIATILRLVKATCRIEFANPDVVERAKKSNKHGVVIFALYHENLFAGIMTHGNKGLAPLASHSKDGQIVTDVMTRIGYQTIRGSSSRGGEQARDDMVDAVSRKLCPTLTVDGPRGPRRVVKGGVVDVARRTGIPIVTMTPIANRHWIFAKSWDQFRMPKPFSKVRIFYGEPIYISGDVKGLAFGEAKKSVKESLEAGEQNQRESTLV